jgi:hypothetical protein
MTSYPTPTWITYRGRVHRAVRPTMAAERAGGYDPQRRAGAGPVGDVVGTPAGAQSSAEGEVGAPFGLAVLGELPQLAQVLVAIDAAEQRMLQAVVGVGQLLADDEVAQATGVSVEHWLAIVCRQTRMDRRLLLRLARLLDRFPALRAGVAAGRVSFAQLRGVGIVARQAPTVIDGELDLLLGRLLDELQGAEPDVLVDQLRQAIVELAPTATPEATETPTNQLYLQPNLSRTGGRFGGELDTLGLAILDEATAPNRDQLRHPGRSAGARAHNLLTRLTHPDTAADAADGETRADAPDGAAGGAGATADAADAPDAPDAAAEGGAEASTVSPRGVQAGGLLPPVKLLVRVQLETLGQLPAEVLTRLTGGHLKLSSQAARYLLDQQGAQLRVVVVDQGEAVGVGRQTRVPPGWLADIIAAAHDTCTEPLCERPARQAHLDHATPWWPDGPDRPYGTTDADNLGPLCGTTNQTPRRGGWHPAQTGDGRRTWTHPRTGLTITTVPTTWRPPGWHPPCHHRDCHHPPGHHHPDQQARAPNATSPPDDRIHGLPPRPPQPPPPEPDDPPF